MPYLGEKIEQVKGEQRSGKDCAFSGLKHLNIITKGWGWSGQVLGSIPALAKKKTKAVGRGDFFTFITLKPTN
jgi:hypothetical protein